ncbi:MAG: C2H2-type zinc finger protein [Candidatus Bathyarchaeota archaeon]|nr:MAG: C2H2-type zinc finger protein [Candidatus Bathyarchaeota archaeon]
MGELKCPICNMTFNTEKELESHKKGAHMKSCGSCC